MLRIAICDDNINFLQEISDMISKWKEQMSYVICESFDNADALLNTHRIAPFDIIFLDIVMPMQNGIEVAREIRKHDKKSQIIFLTASSEYAVESYTVKANNYLLKPISETALFTCLDDALSEISLKPQTITVKGLYSMQKIILDEIMYVEAQNKHIIFTLTDGSIIETTEPLHTYQDTLTLNDGFFKCHRSYIVNINHIDTYTLKEIKMHSGYCIPISRNCQKAFETAYFNVLFGKAGETTH